MRTDSLRRFLAAGGICVRVLTGQLFGQAPGTGAISGVVYDPSNRVIGNAEVLATNEATYVFRSVVTTAEGIFRVALLPPGSYSVTVKAGGFGERTSKSILVTGSETTALNVTLAIAGASASVRVTGSP